METNISYRTKDTIHLLHKFVSVVIAVKKHFPGKPALWVHNSDVPNPILDKLGRGKEKSLQKTHCKFDVFNLCGGHSITPGTPKLHKP